MTNAISLSEAAHRSLEYSLDHLVAYAWFVVVGVLFSAYDLYVADSAFNTLYIRGFAAIYATPLFFYSRIPTTFRQYFHWYWVVGVTIVFPGQFGLMMALNAAWAPLGSTIHSMFVLQYVIGIFVFVQLINDFRLSIVLWLTTSVMIVCVVLIPDNTNIEELLRVLWYNLGAYLTAIVVGSLTNRNIHTTNQSRLDVAQAIGMYVAHELRTPLASVRNLAGGVRSHIQTLLTGYEAAARESLIEHSLATDKIDTLKDALDDIEKQVQHANHFIDGLLLNTKTHDTLSAKLEKFSASDIVHLAINDYPYSNRAHRQAVVADIDEDFTISGPKALVTHVLFNLIKNSLRFSRRDVALKIVIASKAGYPTNTISVWDNGSGIPKEHVGKIFDPFYTTAEWNTGTGVGLSFCKSVMDNIGGAIECESVEGEFTVFRLSFPALAG